VFLAKQPGGGEDIPLSGEKAKQFFLIKKILQKPSVIKVSPDGGMVDTQDLKSCDHNGCAGSSPAPGTEKEVEKTSFFLLKSLFIIQYSNDLRTRINDLRFTELKVTVTVLTFTIFLCSVP
jgi:hypothetical protein